MGMPLPISSRDCSFDASEAFPRISRAYQQNGCATIVKQRISVIFPPLQTIVQHGSQSHDLSIWSTLTV